MKIVPHTLRWRLQIWHGLLLVIVLFAFGFTSQHLQKVERLHRVDVDLQQRLGMVVSELRAAPQRSGQRPEPRKEPGNARPAPQPPRPAEPGGAPPGPNLTFAPEVKALFNKDSTFYYVVWMRSDEPIAASANAPQNVPRPAPEDAATRSRGGHLRETFLFAAPVDCVLVGRSIADEEGALQFNATLLTLVGGGLFLVSLLGGGWVIARAIRPIAKIAETSRRIADGDLTQRIPAEGEESELGQLTTVLNGTFARLEDAFIQQQRFTADAAHELRTPLTILLTQTQSTLARERSAPEYRDALATVQSAAQRMRRLIESLLELARCDAAQEPLRWTACDLAHIAREGIEHLKPLAEAKHVTLRAELSEARCDGDQARLAQILANLLSNAIEYNREGGEVWITTQREGGQAQLVVRDNGPGITPEDLPHVFERFYRADKSRSGATPHTGLGLAISKAFVEAHGGTIEATSQPGQGAEFTVKIPSAHTQRSKVEGSSRASQ